MNLPCVYELDQIMIDQQICDAHATMLMIQPELF